MKKFIPTLISLFATIIAFVISRYDVNDLIPIAFGYTQGKENFIELITTGLIAIVLTIIWGIVTLLIFGFTLYKYIGIILTPLFFIDLFLEKSIWSILKKEKEDIPESSSEESMRKANLEIKLIQIRKGIFPSKKDTTLNHKTGKFMKSNFPDIGETESRYSVDMKTGVYYKDNFIGKIKTGTKIDLKTGEILEDSLLGYTKTGTRVNQENGSIEKKGFFGLWDATDVRIDSKTGKRQKKNFWGEWKDEK